MPGNSQQRLMRFYARKTGLAAAERVLLSLVAVIVVLLPLFVGGGLFASSWELFTQKSFAQLFFSSDWKPSHGEFSFLPFLAGTGWVTMLAILFAVPLSLLVAVYLSEYARPKFAAILKPIIDVVSGLPSVIFGLWGIILIVPFVKDVVSPVFGFHSTGYTILTASLVLALMIVPIIVQVTVEVFASVPLRLREAGFALGATKWEVVKKVVLRRSFPGMFAAVVLALARAFGETLAVMMVVGNMPRIPPHPLSAGSTLPSLIANSYGEIFSVPLYNSALMCAALILFIVVVGFTVVSNIVLARVKRGAA